MRNTASPQMTLRSALGPGFQLSGTCDRAIRTTMQLLARPGVAADQSH